MELFAIPVANGLLPRPHGGTIQGIFLDPVTTTALQAVGTDGEVFLAPIAADDEQLFEVGVRARIEALWVGEVYVGRPPTKQEALFAAVSGIGRARARGFSLDRSGLVAGGVEPLDLSALREQGYPVICGAGWLASGGSTDQVIGGGILVEISGHDLDDGEPLSVMGELEGLVSPYQAHTLEHGIIRALGQYGVCSPRTLWRALIREGDELRASVDVGFRAQVPEVFGVTQSGSCGNPLTRLARFFLVRELVERLKRGDSVISSLEGARRRALSELSSVLEVDTSAGLRVVQGLYRGMRHDDTPLTARQLARVLMRFPADPWS